MPTNNDEWNANIKKCYTECFHFSRKNTYDCDEVMRKSGMVCTFGNLVNFRSRIDPIDEILKTIDM